MKTLDVHREKSNDRHTDVVILRIDLLQTYFQAGVGEDSDYPSQVNSN